MKETQRERENTRKEDTVEDRQIDTHTHTKREREKDTTYRRIWTRRSWPDQASVSMSYNTHARAHIHIHAQRFSRGRRRGDRGENLCTL